MFGPQNDNSWFLINVINAGAAQQLSFSIDAHILWIISADGAYVRPQQVQVSKCLACWAQQLKNSVLYSPLVMLT